MATRKTTSQIVNEFEAVHGQRYDYSLVEYVNASTHVIIGCRVHGQFSQQPRAHLAGQGCSKCNCSENWVYGKRDLEGFIARATSVHGTKYDYTETIYNGAMRTVVIRCPEHGPWKQLANSHLNGSGCPNCAGNYLKTSEEFVRNASVLHGNKYDYSLVKYSGANSKVTIKCPSHGRFEQSPASHLRGSGCIECGREAMSEKHTLDVHEFTSKAKKVHGEKYDYSETVYLDGRSPVVIICRQHGKFVQRPVDHLQKCGCKRCGGSLLQERVVKLLSNYGEVIVNDREIIKPLEIDVWMGANSLGVEVHGDYWHSYDRIETREEKHKHAKKADAAESAGIKLLQFFEHEIENHSDLVESMVLNRIGKSIRIQARKCAIVDVNAEDERGFFNSNHLQGYRPSTVCYGLKHADELMCCMSFIRHPIYEWEIMRLASLRKHVVVGGAGKIFKHFVSNLHPRSIMTYADRRYSTGGVYRSIGFKLDGVTKPGYRYVKRGTVLSRVSCQKHRLGTVLGDGFDPEASESQNMFNNGYRRLWDAGHLRFVWAP